MLLRCMLYIDHFKLKLVNKSNSIRHHTIKLQPVYLSKLFRSWLFLACMLHQCNLRMAHPSISLAHRIRPSSTTSISMLIPIVFQVTTCFIIQWVVYSYILIHYIHIILSVSYIFVTEVITLCHILAGALHMRPTNVSFGPRKNWAHHIHAIIGYVDI